MKANFNGQEVNVLALNRIELFGIAIRLVGAFDLGEEDFPQEGTLYLYADPDWSEDELKDVYRDLKALATKQNFKIPTFAKMPNCEGTVSVVTKYHLEADEDGERIVFDSVEPLPKFYVINEDGEFVEEPEEPEETVEEMRKHWQDFLIPIPPPPKNASDELFLTMAYEPYDAIKRGEKTTEFRDYTESYVKKILSHPIKTVRFQRGYGGPGHPPPEQMVWTVKKISLYEYDAKIECEPGRTDIPIVPDFIAIDIGERVDGTNADTPHEEPVAKVEDNLGIHKTVEFFQSEDLFSPVYKGYSGEFYADARDYARTIMPVDEIDSCVKPCIIFPDLNPGVVEVPQEAAKQILEGRTATKLDVVALRDCEKAGDPVVIEIEDDEPAPNGDQDGSSGKVEEESKENAADQGAKPAKNAYQSARGSLGSSKRWGDNHGPTVTVRAFAPVAERLRTLVQEKDRARFVTEALEAKLNELEETGAGVGCKPISRALFNWLEVLAARISEVIDAYNAGSEVGRRYTTLMHDYDCFDVLSVREESDYAAYLARKFSWLVETMRFKSEIDEEGRKKLPKPIERVIPFSPQSFPNTKIKDSSITRSTLRDRNHRGAFDYLVELRQITHEAAEAINANVGQIDWLDCGCGAVKRFFAVLDRGILDLRTLKVWSTQCDFAAEILRVVLQIFESRDKDYQMAVDLIEPYSPERYPGTRKLADAAEAAGYAEEGEQS